MTAATKKRRTYRKAGREAVQIDWHQFIEQMLDPEVPARLTKRTYSGFKSGSGGRGYSPMNQFWIFLQSQPGDQYPAGPFGTWKALGRNIIKGSKAKTVLKPVFIYKTETDDTGRERKVKIGPVNYTPIKTVFFYSDTEGAPMSLDAEVADWDLAQALANLDITQVNYELTDGNTQGYSSKREFAINPVAAHPMKTMFHELGHIVLGHTAEDQVAEYAAHRGIKEFQAEAVAYIVAHELEMTDWDASESRAYVRTWLRGGEVTERDIRQVFGAVGKILDAGFPTDKEEGEA